MKLTITIPHVLFAIANATYTEKKAVRGHRQKLVRRRNYCKNLYSRCSHGHECCSKNCSRGRCTNFHRKNNGEYMPSKDRRPLIEDKRISTDKERIFSSIGDGVNPYVKAKEQGRTKAMNKAKRFVNKGVQHLRTVGYNKDADEVRKSVDLLI